MYSKKLYRQKKKNLNRLDKNKISMIQGKVGNIWRSNTFIRYYKFFYLETWLRRKNQNKTKPQETPFTDNL